MTITARDGPSYGPHGHFSRGSIKLRPFPVSPWVLPRGEQSCCATWSTELCKGVSLLLWSILFHWPAWQWDPWSQGALKRTFFAIHSFTVTRSGCLFGPTSHTANNMPLQGEKMIPVRRKFAFCSFPAPGSSLKTTMQVILCFDFAYGELERIRWFFCIQCTLTKKSFKNYHKTDMLCLCKERPGELMLLAKDGAKWSQKSRMCRHHPWFSYTYSVC